jgi:hypothetical protein
MSSRSVLARITAATVLFAAANGVSRTANGADPTVVPSSTNTPAPAVTTAAASDPLAALKKAADDYNGATAALATAKDTQTAATASQKRRANDQTTAQKAYDDLFKQISATPQPTGNVLIDLQNKLEIAKKALEETNKALRDAKDAVGAANDGVNNATKTLADKAAALAKAVQDYINKQPTTSSSLPAVPPTPKTAADHQPMMPFSFLPLVAELKSAKVMSDFSDSLDWAKGYGSDASKRPASERFFSLPATFTLWDFNSTCDPAPVPTDIATIYEEMHVAFYDDGRCVVHFAMETPAEPITLRLQFHVKSATDDCCVHTLTLPPINIPARDDRLEAHDGTFIVHHEAYYDLVKRNKGCLDVLDRIGSARFGFGNSIN